MNQYIFTISLSVGNLVENKIQLTSFITEKCEKEQREKEEKERR